MARGRSGVISKEYKGEENTAYHDVIKLFKIYRAVNWQMQIKIELNRCAMACEGCGAVFSLT